MTSLQKVRQELYAFACPCYAETVCGFFKTRKGTYGYGDKFLGVKVPQQRVLAKKYANMLTFKELACLLKSRLHEERMLALLVLILWYQRGDVRTQRTIYDFYFKHITQINNWDLVDVSAPVIVGSVLLNKNKKVLYKLVRAKSLWKRRIAIVATLYFIRHGVYTSTLMLAETLLYDKEDLIHKATGWMLREVGKRDVAVLMQFLAKNGASMPRTMWRYARERIDKVKQTI